MLVNKLLYRSHDQILKPYSVWCSVPMQPVGSGIALKQASLGIVSLLLCLDAGNLPFYAPHPSISHLVV